MSTKTYKSGTCLHINVYNAAKKANIHVSFDPISGGGSSYTTDKEDIQKALEAHRGFGKLFALINTEEPTAAKTEGTDETAAPEAEAETPTVETKTEIEVSDFAEARDLLADKFGISRTALRSKAAVAKAAEQYNIEFIYKSE
jgi:hypothetical protein